MFIDIHTLKCKIIGFVVFLQKIAFCKINVFSKININKHCYMIKSKIKHPKTEKKKEIFSNPKLKKMKKMKNQKKTLFFKST
jgi:hypothetical protein